ncbi:MAG: monovalent cation/H(+) antiporter subunit G [Hydrogenophaga sp.]|jgi:multicomponent Na+:H+ antiporter subunit G|uniref:monovalent cation/H(+) antiporter subunit G n=1 Tax=Hydrogenophaga sp. TaxID=1904254 RepID=UPI002AB8C559|nr:monovalent cation/H(+) antiporter subunit G [Hydrogenophaga sp.]MDZ4189947.1 monovalent cation/H(+) antiporter subunit G [Hydrogenophaga sp.]
MSPSEWLAGLFLVAGGFFVLVGGVGMLRMPDLYTRMHATSVTETMGTLLVMIGLMIVAGWTLASFKLFAILLFLLFTGPVASYAVANTALIAGVKPRLHNDAPLTEAPEGPHA